MLSNTAGSSGQACISGGTGAPTFGTLGVAGGGSGVATFANTSALITSGTTSTGAVQNIASVATGQVLVSAGTSTLPTWSATPAVTSVTLGGGTALANYVQSTFTPTIQFGGAAVGVTYTTQTGTYTRVGNIVFFSIILTLSNKGSSTGAAAIAGLPIATGTVTFGSIPYETNLTFTATYTNAYWTTSASTLVLYQFGAVPGANTALDDTNFGNTTDLRFSGTYFV
jgi:hypothetical protein